MQRARMVVEPCRLGPGLGDSFPLCLCLYVYAYATWSRLVPTLMKPAKSHVSGQPCTSSATAAAERTVESMRCRRADSSVLASCARVTVPRWPLLQSLLPCKSGLRHSSSVSFYLLPRIFIVSYFSFIENIMTRLPKIFDEFTILKQFTMKFTGLTIEKKRKKPLKVAQNGPVLSPGAKSDRF